MNDRAPSLMRRMLVVSVLAGLLLAASIVLGLSLGSTGGGSDFWNWAFGDASDPVLETIVWNIRLPRVLMAALVGAVLSLGGLVFQALLRNPLAEPYILGISGGSAVGAIIGILMGRSRFPGVSITAFAGSMATLALILLLASNARSEKRLPAAFRRHGQLVLHGGHHVLVSMTQDSRLHNIIYWLMGDLASADMGQVKIVCLMVLPCVVLIFCLSHAMNLLLMGRNGPDHGVNIAVVTLALLTVTSLMVSLTVSACGLLRFVGLVIPHLLRLILGPDHRVSFRPAFLAEAPTWCFCDVLARVLPQQGEMPAGVITAMIGAPLFVSCLEVRIMTDALTVKDLSYDYAGRPVLSDVSFAAGRGSFSIIIGPNGSGKTTLMKIMAGVLHHPDVVPKIFMKPLNRYGRKRLARRLAFVPQSVPAFPLPCAR